MRYGSLANTGFVKLTNRDNTLDNLKVLDVLPCICTLGFVVLLDSSTRSIRDVVFAFIGEALHLLKNEVVDIQPGDPGLAWNRVR